MKDKKQQPAVSEEEIEKAAVKFIKDDLDPGDDRPNQESVNLAINYFKKGVNWLQSLNVQGEGKYCACVGLPYGLTSVALCAKCKLIWKPVANLPPTSEEKGGGG